MRCRRQERLPAPPSDHASRQPAHLELAGPRAQRRSARVLPKQLQSCPGLQRGLRKSGAARGAWTRLFELGMQLGKQIAVLATAQSTPFLCEPCMRRPLAASVPSGPPAASEPPAQPILTDQCWAHQAIHRAAGAAPTPRSRPEQRVTCSVAAPLRLQQRSCGCWWRGAALATARCPMAQPPPSRLPPPAAATCAAGCWCACTAWLPCCW